MTRDNPLRERLLRNGFLPDAIALADKHCCTQVLNDAALSDAAMAEFSQRGVAGVPYMITDAITRLAHDAAVIEVVQTLLGTERWVMWGANIRRSVPNEAHNWHVDLESVLWPSITIAVGLDGCDEQSSTWFIPGTQEIHQGPVNWLPRNAPTPVVVAKAHALCGHERPPLRVNGFENGAFIVFNGACWHRADAIGSTNKTVLYLHYQDARDKRIPHMLDYATHHWSAKPCPYISSAQGQDANTAVHRPPLRHRIEHQLARFRAWRQ